ncbi:MAG: integrase core domain-containing protein [Rehaibacterium terrae]|uniref:integrase core domain-containing protein n=1 Tax=Rehaibacterium terrae TaxID=1341696 RepID=UPI0039196A65
MGAAAWHRAHPDRTGLLDAERVHREIQRQVPRRMPQRALVTSLAQARDVIADWRRDYNEVRPHSSCGRIPPSQFAANHRAQQDNNAVTFNPGLCQ